MTPSMRDDFILRQVEAIMALLIRMTGLRQAGQVEEARLELERAYGILLGSEGALVRRLDSATAVEMLSAPERILAYARLLREEAAQAGDGPAAAALRLRALEFALEAADRGGTSDEVLRTVSELASGVNPEQLRDEHREALGKLLDRNSRP